MAEKNCVLILIKIETEKICDVIKKFISLKDKIKEMFVVTGIFDLVLLLENHSQQEIIDIIKRDIQNIEGIKKINILMTLKRYRHLLKPGKR